MRHARDITFTNVDFGLRNPNKRPAYALEDVKAIFINGKNNEHFQVKDEPRKAVYTAEIK